MLVCYVAKVAFCPYICTAINKIYMRTVYYLGTCDTCTKIIESLGGLKDFRFREIKTEPMTGDEVDQMKKLSGSYESLFSRRSMQYKARNLKDKKLTEKDYRALILDHYTFLSRPVFLIDGKIYIGNSPKNIEAVRAAIHV